MWSFCGSMYYLEHNHLFTTHIIRTSTLTMTSWCPPPLRRILIIRNICPPIRSFRRRLLLQQRLLQQLIRLLGTDFIVSVTVENYPQRPQIVTLRQLLESSWIFEGDLHSVVSSGRNHLYVGGVTTKTKFNITCCFEI